MAEEGREREVSIIRKSPLMITGSEYLQLICDRGVPLDIRELHYAQTSHLTTQSVLDEEDLLALFLISDINLKLSLLAKHSPKKETWHEIIRRREQRILTYLQLRRSLHGFEKSIMLGYEERSKPKKSLMERLFGW